MKRSLRREAGAAFVLLALAVAGCSGWAGTARPLRHGPGVDQVLVVLPSAPRVVWEQRARELAASHGLYLYAAWIMRSLDLPCIVYGVPPGESMARVVARLAADQRVELAQPVQTFETLGGGDPYGELQAGMRTMRVAAAHRWATGRGVKVAVVDTGVDVGHPDLAGRVAGVGNFVDRGEIGFTRDVHGTAVAGVLAADAGNGVGIAGVAPEASLLALKACWPRAAGASAATCDSYSLAQAVDAAVSGGAQVLNLSLAGPQDPLLGRLLTAALAGGATVVVAADPRRPDLGFPAALPGVVAVIDADAPTPAAALGRPGVVSAPGRDVLTTVPGGAYDFLSGSSMAAAEVSGVVALLLERAPRLTPVEVGELLAGAAGPRPAVERPGAAGGGVAAGPPRVDACAALARLVGLAEGCPGAGAVAR